MPNILLILFNMALFSGYFIIIEVQRSQLFMLLIGLVSIIISVKNKISKKFILLLITYSFFGFISKIYNNNMDLVEMFWPISYWGIALLILTYPINTEIVYCNLILYSLIILYKIIKYNSTNQYILGLASSRNHISIHLLYLYILFRIENSRKNKYNKYLPLLSSLIISVLAFGRAGILTFSVLFFFELFIMDSSYKRISIRLVLKIIITIILLTSIFYILINKYYPKLFIELIDSIEKRGIESIRTNIWLDYFSIIKNNVLNLLFGAKIQGGYVLNDFSENMHNSFLMLHSKYGIISVFGLVYLIFNSAFFAIKKRKYYLIILLLSLLIRMNFDYTNFNSLLDIPLIVILLFRNSIQLKSIGENT